MPTPRGIISLTRGRPRRTFGNRRGFLCLPTSSPTTGNPYKPISPRLLPSLAVFWAEANANSTSLKATLESKSAEVRQVTSRTVSGRNDFIGMRSTFAREFWSVVLLGGTCMMFYVVVVGWFGPPVNVPGLLIGFAAACAGLIGVARAAE